MSALGGKADIRDGAEKGWITVIHFLGLSLVCLATKIRRDTSEKICRGPGRGIVTNARPHPLGGVGVPRAWTYTLPLEANQQCASQQARTKKSQRDPSNKRSKAVLCESSSNVGVESALEY